MCIALLIPILIYIAVCDCRECPCACLTPPEADGDKCDVCETTPCEASTVSAMFPVESNGMLGCRHVSSYRWMGVCGLSDCEREETRGLLAGGFESFRRDPVRVASEALRSTAMPAEWRCAPAYLEARAAYCGRFFVLLGSTLLGNVAFELENFGTPSEPLWDVAAVAIN